jgi:hypothetical protein
MTVGERIGRRIGEKGRGQEGIPWAAQTAASPQTPVSLFFLLNVFIDLNN